ncbi:hypothetical protein A3J61_02470 [Candidatus Nomurabacteria bacterium RIFCSPHIGHO2_02_FULL_38_15]|uniref:Peptidoglycan binding-like domain-containing protein n=1 Tax=Candidatus Nomurabacteria bacterium RIFCSPHIGHO2_02_FULL_38_15 TaxID=1801752 RepID=A0A1F6VS40_9BACT|nr:MAG: hypothetical protein A3J61_02470 [Candidatus Nomurabacteria bacterium RIFCSPHIGHO2_02_FULL_38_15]
MKKYLKVALMSFVFIMAFGLFAGTAFAAQTWIMNSVPPPNGACSITRITEGTFNDGTPYTETRTSTVGKMVDGFCVGATFDRNSINPDGTLIKTENSPIDQGEVANPADPFGDTTPRYGNKNSEAVRNIQAVLLESGIPVVIDGNFGPNTKRGIMTFQIQNNLPQTGLFDQNTRAVMEAKLLGTDTPNPAIETPINDIVSLKNTTTALEKIKSEIASLSDMLSKLAQQASAIMAGLPK